MLSCPVRMKYALTLNLQHQFNLIISFYFQLFPGMDDGTQEVLAGMIPNRMLTFQGKTS